MNRHSWQRDLDDAFAVVRREQAGAARYRRRQAQVRRGRLDTADRPRPLEFDETGSPVAERSPGLVSRVARLLSAS
jgi:hypothetical protein